MAETTRGNILENMRSIIEALSRVVKAEVDSTTALHTVEPTNIPFVNITSSAAYDQVTSGLGDQEVWQLKVDVDIITLSGNVENIRGDIKEAISADNERGSNAMNTVYKTDSSIIDVVIPAGAQSIRMIYEITYKTSEGKKT